MLKGKCKKFSNLEKLPMWQKKKEDSRLSRLTQIRSAQIMTNLDDQRSKKYYWVT